MYIALLKIDPNIYTVKIETFECLCVCHFSGMKPVMFSVQEASEGRPTWVRTGYDICYHKNHFSRIPKSHDPTRSKRQAANACYYTATFTVVFPHSHDICYIAYHYPYTYTRLKASLNAHLSFKFLGVQLPLRLAKNFIKNIGFIIITWSQYFRL